MEKIKNKKSILFALIYLIISLLLYKTVDMEVYGVIFQTINMLGIGIFGGSLLILGIEDLVKRFQDSGRLGHLDKLEKSKYANITFIVGFSSLLLEITRNFIL